MARFVLGVGTFEPPKPLCAPSMINRSSLNSLTKRISRVNAACLLRPITSIDNRAIASVAWPMTPEQIPAVPDSPFACDICG
ncbi:hypothetical protein Q8W71_31495 [Methylobacterium sp. NEAU 140]|nr:hypothetical protein [Methylobacterium sp. NEAU 140]